VAVYPALDVADADFDRVIVVVDDYSPTAVEEHGASLTIYFASQTARDEAERAVARELPFIVTRRREVDDEDWARRSQLELSAITVGRITVAPPWTHTAPGPSQSSTVVISPSMGFGTGHHATTRLSLRALQTVDLSERSLVDVGTGSGVLAIAARLLGARAVVGFDADPDAIRSAEENLLLNPWVDRVQFEVADLRAATMPAADVVTANLTGALLARSAPELVRLVVSGGQLIVSGLLGDERALVEAAVLGQARAAAVVWAQEEDGWVGLVFNLEPGTAV
jgi:ribosomal protein L11 methyltransferase